MRSVFYVLFLHPWILKNCLWFSLVIGSHCIAHSDHTLVGSSFTPASASRVARSTYLPIMPCKLFLSKNRIHCGTGQMTQQLRTLAALPDDPGSIPGTHVVAHTTVILIPGAPMLCFGFQGLGIHVMYR